MKRSMLGAVLVVLTGCGVSESSISDRPDVLQVGTRISWEDFKAHYAFQEPETGIWIADGDTPFTNEKQLREFYDLNVADGQLIVDRSNNTDNVWNATAKLNITYCISNNFGSNKTAVVQAMASATGAWAAAANVKFVYLSAQDGSCTASNSNVVFDVRPVNVNGQYLARAFFPNETRANRNVLIDNTAFGDPSVSLVGVLRHELGHTLGFRHEHTRPEAGTCFEDNNWRALTPYDSASVMHYPQCNGTGSFTDLNLTALDKQGAAALYGAPSGTGGGTGGGAGGGTGGGAGGGAGGGTGGGTAGSTVENFSGSVAKGGNKAYGPFAVAAGTTFRAVLSGTGDADLYVRFGAAPTLSSFNCRPYLDGSAEECNLTVPAGQTSAYVTINGYTASTFSLRVEYTQGSTTPPPTGGTPQTGTASGNVGANEQVQFNPITVKPGTTFTVNMTGSGDPDLYLRFGAAPTLTLFDCRPYKNGATESCSVTVPATQSQVFMMVHGYSAGSYTLNVSYTAP